MFSSKAPLIDDLLDQSLITLGKLRLRTELVDAHRLLQQSLENLHGFIRDADLIARLERPLRIAGSPPIRAGFSKSSGI